MPDYLLHFIVYSALLVGVMLLAELSYRLLQLKTEWTRKIAHVGSGMVALSYPQYLESHWVVLALTLSFTVILYTSKKMGLFQSIFSVGRKSYGELYFVWSSWLLFWLFQATGEVTYFYVPFAIVVFADPAAALIGTYLPIRKYTVFGNHKSVAGSGAFFVVSFFLSYFLLNKAGINANTILLSLLHAALLTIVEAISPKGSDNLTIPVFSVLFLYFIL